MRKSVVVVDILDVRNMKSISHARIRERSSLPPLSPADGRLGPGYQIGGLLGTMAVMLFKLEPGL